MRNLVVILAVSSLAGTLAAVGCSSNSGGGASTTTTTHTNSSSGTGGTTTATSSSSSTSSSTSSGTGGTGTGGSTTGTGGSASTAAPICTGIPATAPSMGSCVSFSTDAGVELDAGLDDAGNATQTNCNPVTNEGCTGTDTCNPDNSGKYWVCQPVGTMPNIAVCGDCTAAQAYCKFGGLCVGVTKTMAQCWQMCCSDADCGGAAGSCATTGVLQNPLPNNVGICFTQ